MLGVASPIMVEFLKPAKAMGFPSPPTARATARSLIVVVVVVPVHDLQQELSLS